MRSRTRQQPQQTTGAANDPVRQAAADLVRSSMDPPTDASGMEAATTMGYTLNTLRQQHNAERMEAKEDARLKCMYEDYEPPDPLLDSEDPLQIIFNQGGAIGDKALLSLRKKNDEQEPDQPTEPCPPPSPRRQRRGVPWWAIPLAMLATALLVGTLLTAVYLMVISRPDADTQYELIAVPRDVTSEGTSP